MKTIFKIIAYVMLSVVGLVGVVFGYAYVTGALGEQRIPITELTFEQVNTLVIDDFSTKLNFLPEDATNREISLTVTTGSDVISVPSTIKAGEEFEIKLKKDANNNNIGGRVVITAQNKEIKVSKDLEFWVDIAIPNNGLVIESNLNGGSVSAGGGQFDIYVFTNPKHAIYPNKSDNPNEFSFLNNEYTYKEIELKSNNTNSLKVLGEGVNQIGYYNAKHKENGLPVFINLNNRPEGMQLETMRYVKFVVEPGVSSQNLDVVLSAKSLRTYFMQNDFVDVNLYDNKDEGYTEFSEYIEKYKHYIETDVRPFLDDENFVVYENGADFINSVTNNGNSNVYIAQNERIKFNAAMFYLYVENSIEYTVEDVGIKELTTKQSDINVFDLLESKEYFAEDLIHYFGLHIHPDNSTVNENVLRNKIANVKIAAVMGQPATISDESYVEGKKTLVEELDASEFIEVLNPTPTRPSWIIRAVNSTNSSAEQFVGLKFYIVENEVEHYSLEEVVVNESIPGNLSLNLALIPNTFAINGGEQDKSIFLNNNLYNINPNATYNEVRFFVKAESARNGTGKMVFQFDDVLESELHRINEISVYNQSDDEEISVYEITYSQLNALNVSNNGKVKFFAAIVKTDVDGVPLYHNGVEGNYIILEKTNDVELEVISYVEDLIFYTFETIENEDGSVTRQNFINRNTAEESIKLLYGQPYQLILTNHRLDSHGKFDPNAYINIPGNYGYNIDYLVNERYALREADEHSWLEIDIRKDHDYDLIDIQRIISNYDFVYEEDNNFLVLTLRTFNLNTEIDVDSSIEFYLSARYKEDFRPTLMQQSSVTTNVQFASVDSVSILNTSGITDGGEIINITASANEGKVQWRDGSGKIFLLNEIEYNFDIQQRIAVVEEGEELEEGETEPVEPNEDEIVYRYTSEKLDLSHRNEEFVNSYVLNLVNSMFRITIESDKPDFAEVYINSNGLPVINIIKGTPAGELVNITVTISIYGDATGNFMQTKTANITLNLIQENPQSYFHSERTLNNEFMKVGVGEGNYIYEDNSYIEVAEGAGDYIKLGDHYVKNSEINPQDLKAGENRDLLFIYPEGERRTVYSYNLAEGSEKQIEGNDNTLLDVRFVGSQGSVIGDVEFEIITDINNEASIYFLVEDEEGKLVRSYRSFANKDMFDVNSNYELVVYADSISSTKLEKINVISPLFGTYTYYIRVLNNLEFDVSTGTSIKTELNSDDTREINLSDNFSVKQKITDTEIINLPVSFELNLSSQNQHWGELSIANVNEFNVSHTLKSNRGYVLQDGEVNNATVEKFNTIFNPYMVMETKHIGLTMFYYVPKLDDFGNFIFVATSPDAQGKLVYQNRETGAYYYLDTITDENDEEIEVQIDYTGPMQFLFEKNRVVESISSIEVLPTLTVRKGENLSSEIVVKSGVDKNLFNVQISDSTNQTKTTNFIDVLNTTTNPYSLLLPEQITDYDNVDYSSIYNKYVELHIKTDDYSVGTEEHAAFLTLNPKIDENGVLTSNPINRDLMVTVIVNVYEGEMLNNKHLVQNANLSFNIKILFENSVRFEVTNEIVDGNTSYLKTENPNTNEIIGHVFNGLGVVEENLETNENEIVLNDCKEIVLYSLTNEVEDNIVNILGGDEINYESLLSKTLESAKLYVYNGFIFEEYLGSDVTVELTRNTQGNVAKISVFLNNIINDSMNFMVEFKPRGFEIEGGAKYYFTVNSSIVLQTNYPVMPDYEVVQNETTVNMHSSYINPLSRVTINLKSYEQVSEDEGDYINISNNLFAYVGQGKGDYVLTLTEYEIENSASLKLVSGTNVVTIIDNLNEVENWFTYTLLDSNKQPIQSPELNKIFPVKANNYNNASFTFNNITNNKVLYIRVQVLDSVYIDYKFEVKVGSNAEQFVFEKENNQPIDDLRPLEIVANNESSWLNIFNYIRMLNGGSHSNLLIKYNSYGSNMPYAEQKVGDGEFEAIAMHELVLQNSLIRFEDVVENKLVSFSVYGKSFTSGMEPKIFYVRVVPNFNVSTKSQVPAGILNNLNSIFTLSGNTENVDIEIYSVDNNEYNEENPENYFGAKIVGSSDADINNQFIINDVNKDVKVVFKITKTFAADKVLEKFFEVVVKPNAIFANGNPNFVLEKTAAPAPPQDPINLFDEVSDNPYFYATEMVNNNRIIENAYVNISYQVFTIGMQEMQTNEELLSLGINDFNSATGNFKILSVNSEKQFIIRLTIEWVRLVGSETDYDNSVSIYHNYKVRILPRVVNSEIEITYSNPATRQMNVLEGSVVEIDFDSNRTNFVKQESQFINVTANQITELGAEMPISVVMLLEETNRYRLFEHNDKFYIEFKNLNNTAEIVNIQLYFDLTNQLYYDPIEEQLEYDENTLGFVTSIDGLYINENAYITFLVQPSLQGVVLKTHGEVPNSQANPHQINTDSMSFVDYGKGNGDFEFIVDIVDGDSIIYYNYVGKGNGRFVLKESVLGYAEVAEGEGDFEFISEDGFEYYKYVGNGEGNYVLVEDQPEYVYIGNNLGEYNFINDEYVIGENGVGDYIKLGKTQIDLFKYLELSLHSLANNFTLLTTPTESPNLNGINMHLLRKSFVFTSNNVGNVQISNGIAEFAPTSTDKEISITASLYGDITKSVTIWVRLGAGAVIAGVANNDVVNNSPATATEIIIEDSSENLKVNLKDYLIYGYSLIIEEGLEYGVEEPEEPIDPEEEEFIVNNGDIVYSDNITLIKRNDVFMVVINLSKNLINYDVDHINFINVEALQNGYLEFKSYNEIKALLGNEEDIIIKVTAQLANGQAEDLTSLYFKITLED